MTTSHTDQVVLVERDVDDDASSQDSTAHRRRQEAALPCAPSSPPDVLDKVACFAMLAVLTGLIFAAVGFLYPRDIRRDPAAPARDNETVDIEYMKLTEALNAIIITGVVLIGIGGLILSALFTNTVLCQECRWLRRRSDAHVRGATALTSPPTAVTSAEERASVTEKGPSYGALDSALTPQ